MNQEDCNPSPPPENKPVSKASKIIIKIISIISTVFGILLVLDSLGSFMQPPENNGTTILFLLVGAILIILPGYLRYRATTIVSTIIGVILILASVALMRSPEKDSILAIVLLPLVGAFLIVCPRYLKHKTK